MKLYEVTYSLYDDEKHIHSGVNLMNLKETIQAHTSSQAQEIVRAKYGSRCQVYGVKSL